MHTHTARSDTLAHIKFHLRHGDWVRAVRCARRFLITEGYGDSFPRAKILVEDIRTNCPWVRH